MFTKNFFFFLENLFYRNTDNSALITFPKTYDGATNYTHLKRIVNAGAQYVFATGAFSIYNTTGVVDNLSSEEDLLATKNYKTGSNSTELTTVTDCAQERAVTIMILGEGSTAPTVDDYKLENFIGTDRLTCTNCYNYINDTLSGEVTNIITRAWTFQNISDEPVTVKELGLVSMFERDYNPKYVLTAREVLSSPVTIAPSAKYTFEFNLAVTGN